MGDEVGGYFLSVESAQYGTETVYVPPSPSEDTFYIEDTFDRFVSSDPVLGEYELDSLRELAVLVCEEIDNDVQFDEIWSSIYTESPADWDIETSSTFLVAAVYGLCPEHTDAIDRWAGQL